MAQKGIDFGLTHVARVLLRSKVFDITDDLVAVGLFCKVGVMMGTQNLPDLVHELQSLVRSELSLIFHGINNQNVETWKNQWDIFHVSNDNMKIGGKFSII